MSKIQSHENCTHASSKAARAKCRRSRARFANELALAMAEPETIEAPAPVFESVAVTQENWREHKSDQVEIFVRVSDDEESVVATNAYITGWGARWINYTVQGTNKRTANSCTGARTVEKAM